MVLETDYNSCYKVLKLIMYKISILYCLCVFSITNLKRYLPVGNCDEANLVSRIPAPSIKANRMPPMAAEPTMATGPSEEEQRI